MADSSGSSQPPTPAIIVRYRKPNTATKWNEGRVLNINEDGSVEFVDEYSGGIRTMREELLEMKTRGPRGGIHWVPLADL